MVYYFLAFNNWIILSLFVPCESGGFTSVFWELYVSAFLTGFSLRRGVSGLLVPNPSPLVPPFDQCNLIYPAHFSLLR